MPTPTRPADRYGDRGSPGRRRLAVAAVVVAAVGGLAWLAWAGTAMADREVRWDDVGYRVVDDVTLRVTFDVVKAPTATVTCTVQGLNAGYGVVGLVRADVGPADGRAVRSTVTVPTQERAVSGVVERCEPAD